MEKAILPNKDKMIGRREMKREQRKNGKVQEGKTGVLSDLLYDFKHNKLLMGMTLPGIVYFIVFCYLPMMGIVIAFQKFSPVKGILGSKFVGFDNFKFFLGSKDAFRVTFNTVYLNAIFIITGMIAAIAIAIMLSEMNSKWYKKGAQSIIILPHFISWTVVALLAEALLSADSGIINAVLTIVGMEPIAFYQNPDVWPGLLTILKIWQGAGFSSIIYLAAITGIDQEIYEAAKIDGASRWRCIIHITLPLLKNTALLMFIMSVGKIFNGDFGMIYAMVGNNALLYPTTDVIDTYVYRQLMELGDMGMSAAVGFYQSVIGFAFVYITNQIARKVNPESAIF